ncbi:MAG: LytR/AlgR family response regulator transcription factor [Flavobacterium sp.]
MKAIIIEDEKRAQIYLENTLLDVAPLVEVVEICDDLPTGVVAIKKHQPDLVFLDIEMPKFSGLDIVKFFNLEEINFKIIFTTAYNQYAIEGYQVMAIDYLLKPINPEKLKIAIDRACKMQKIDFEKISQLQNKANNTTKIAFPDGNQVVLIDPNEIVYLKADNSYTQINLASGKKMITSRFLKNFEESLQYNSDFFRCHKSYIINTQYLESFSKSNGGTAILQQQIEIPVSIDKVEELLSKFVKVNR